VEDWNWKTIFYGHCRSIFNNCDIIGQQSYQIRWKKREVRAITPFKVIQGHRSRYQSKARMRLSVSNWHPISYRFEVIAAYCLKDTLRFWATLWGLGITYTVDLALIGKRVVDFILVLIEFFSLAVTAEALPANIGSKSAMSLQRGHFDLKFQVRGRPTNH